MNQDRRVAVMHGAVGSQGMGVVRALLKQNMQVVMITHQEDGARAALSELGCCRDQCTYLLSKNGNEQNLRTVYEQFGSVDILIPNQGFPGKYRALEEVSRQEMERCCEHYLVSTYDFIHAGLPYLKQQKWGRILLMSDLGGRYGSLRQGLPDAVAKGGVIAMTRYLSRELAPSGITVNCIVKGCLENGDPSGSGVPSPADHALPPAGRTGTPEEFGALVSYLVSEEAGFTTGQVIDLAGGMTG